MASSAPRCSLSGGGSGGSVAGEEVTVDVEGSGGGFLVDTASGAANYAGAPDLTSEFEVKLLRPPSRLGFGYAANEAAQRPLPPHLLSGVK